MAKVAVIVLEGTELKESVAKMRHAMIYSKEIKAEGNEIILQIKHVDCHNRDIIIPNCKVKYILLCNK